MKIIFGYILFVLLMAMLLEANSKSNCESFVAQFVARGVPGLCLAGDTLCDVHCTCIHNATYGKCIDYPTDDSKIYVPQPKPSKMCTCDYMRPRPSSMTLPITRENCLLQHIPLSNQLISSLLCSTFCEEDCICAHGFESGSCVAPFCICNGKGPLN